MLYGAVRTLPSIRKSLRARGPARVTFDSNVRYAVGQARLIRDTMSDQMGAVGQTPSGSIGAVVHWPDAPREEVLAELRRILESHHFHASKKCSRFLRHVIEASLNGRFECLKERTLGVDVFDREPHYDTNQDPIVRGTAGEVRKRLAQYYLEAGEGEFRLTLPPGSYIPELHSAMPERTKATMRKAAAAAPAKWPKKLQWTTVAACAITVGAVYVWLIARPTDLDRFWAPVLHRDTVLVCMGQPHYYTFRFNTARALNSWFAEGVENQQAPQLTSVPLHEIVPMWDKSMALADAQAFLRLVNLFAQRRKQFDLRGERSVSLSDLRGRPSVLIGAFDNEWSLNLTGELRFYFDTDAATRAQLIRDRQKPASHDWELVDAWPPGKDIDKDYALVTRVVNRTTERTTIVIGGISQFGTEAAAEFVTNPDYFRRALPEAPRDWYRKNIQVVLSTTVLSGVSGPPSVVATHFW